jgi:hypothetical protein
MSPRSIQYRLPLCGAGVSPLFDMARLLKGTANIFMAGVLVRRVAGDLAVEARKDVVRSPYGAAGAATLLGVLAGVLLVKQHRRRTND